MTIKSFPFLDGQEASVAFETFVLPIILAASVKGLIARTHLHILALKPGVPYEANTTLPILWEAQVGSPSEWEWDYRKFAEAKARLSWRTGLSSREVLQSKMHLIEKGDTVYYGSVVMDGLIVGVSGVQEYFDEMFARMTAAALCAKMVRNAGEFAKQDKVPDFF
jgi:hypothetical protein